MAWQLLNRVYTIGTIDGAQDITPGAAQTGFRDFTLLSASNTTYIVGVQGSKWAYMLVQKIGSILRPSTYIDGSNGIGASVTFDAGTITVISDLGSSKVVYVDGDGNAQNAAAVLNTFSPATLVALKTVPLPSSGQTVVYLREISDGSKDGAFYVWDPDETASGDDFSYVVSSLSATGRWVRQTPILGVPDLANDAAAYSESIYGVSDDLRHKDSTDVVKKIPRTENYHQGEFITFAQWKAIDSGQWAANQTFVFRGITAENDLAGQRLTFKWDASSTNTDALDVTHIRPDDISGSNPGRAVIVEPAAATKFADSDDTPSMKGSRIHRCADTVPAAITALDDMVDGEPHYIYPGAQAQVFTHGASLVCESGADFTLRTDSAPIVALSDNGVVYLLTGGVAVLDEDDFASDSATRPPSQQSVKAYVDLDGVVTKVASQTIANAADYTVIADMTTSGKRWDILAFDLADPEMNASCTVFGDASDPVVDITQEVFGNLTFEISTNALVLANDSGSSADYYIEIRERG